MSIERSNNLVRWHKNAGQQLNYVAAHFIEVYASADYVDTVNTRSFSTLCAPRNDRVRQRREDGSADEVLPICTMPRCLFKVNVTPWTPTA
jgi:hypothetical protein